ncbi:hypothetical protein BROUX41_003479 [Berkeleyomyces rouxiae]
MASPTQPTLSWPSAYSPAMIRSEHALEIAANVALARQIYDIPEAPIIHDPIEESSCRLPPAEWYHLPPQKEVELAHALAVASKLKDESHYTTAVTVTEDPKSRRLVVLLAVNRASPEDGLEEHEQSHNALAQVLSIMSEVRSYNNDGLEDRILEAVVEACKAKILARMGLAPCRHNKTRMPLDTKLSKVVGYYQSKHEHIGVGSPDEIKFVHYGHAVLAQMAHCRNNPNDMRLLAGMVRGLHALNENVPALGFLMDNMRENGKIIVQSAVNSILPVVSKTAYYVRIARTLYRTAKKYPIARRARIVPVILPPAAFAQTPLPMPGSPASSVLLRDPRIRRLSPSASPASIHTILSILNNSSKARRAGEGFQEVMHTSLTGRIHAEMQIIYFLNMPENSYLLPPRAVCASKASCFLCNAYATVYRSVYMPYSHGRMYTNWRLPHMDGLEIPEVAFIGRLELHIGCGLSVLVSCGRTPERKEPAQSVMMSLNRSTSSVGDLREYDAEQEDADAFWTEDDELENYVDEITEVDEEELDDEEDMETEPHLLLEHPDHEPNNLLDDDEDEDEEVQDAGPYQNGVSVNGTNPYGSNPLGTNPMGTNPFGSNPMGTNPMGTNPNGSVAAAPAMVESHRELANESAEVETAPTTPEPEPELQHSEADATTKRDVASEPFTLPERPKQHFIRAQSAPVASSSAAPLVPDVPASVTEESVAPTPMPAPVSAEEPVRQQPAEETVEASSVPAAPAPLPETPADMHRMPVPTPPTHAAVPFAVTQHELQTAQSYSYAVSYESAAVSDDLDDEPEVRERPKMAPRGSEATRPVVVNSSPEMTQSASVLPETKASLPYSEPAVQVVEVAKTVKAVVPEVKPKVAPVELDIEPAAIKSVGSETQVAAETEVKLAAEPIAEAAIVPDSAPASPQVEIPEIPVKAAAREPKEDQASVESTPSPALVDLSKPVVDATPEQVIEKPEEVVVDVQPMPKAVAAPVEASAAEVASELAPAEAPVAVKTSVAADDSVATVDFAVPAAVAAPSTTVSAAEPITPVAASVEAAGSASAPTPAPAAVPALATVAVPAVGLTPPKASTPASAPAASVPSVTLPAAKTTGTKSIPAPASIASGRGSEAPKKKSLRYWLKSLSKRGKKTTK